MNLADQISKKAGDNLQQHLGPLFPEHPFKDVYLYSLLPAGKLFRPCLALSAYSDLSNINPNEITNNDSISFAASALEIHHTYTLIHDDLPCMDDDIERRGRPSSHIKFNEWKALLAGDGLLNASYGLLSKSNHENALKALKVFSWATGPKGLIQGQVLDLSEEMNLSFENLLLTHKLKTARLIQVALLFGMLYSSKSNYRLAKSLWRLGYSMGISFQLLDDLSELAEENPGKHEMSVNPWPNDFTKCQNTLIKEINLISETIESDKLLTTKEVIKSYFTKMEKIISKERHQIEDHIKSQDCNIDLLPIVSALKTIC
ncbi:MAG: polyprenyl synthetase family protein [Bacteriovoracaceae bacterium]|nr:polyprenyl synthetase family protein [Bacteriovoracaceae bacterium]